MKYIKRLPVEFQVVTMRETLRRNKEMKSNTVVKTWIANSAAALF
jgi:hypothetical protein